MFEVFLHSTAVPRWLAAHFFTHLMSLEGISLHQKELTGSCVWLTSWRMVSFVTEPLTSSNLRYLQDRQVQNRFWLPQVFVKDISDVRYIPGQTCQDKPQVEDSLVTSVMIQVPVITFVFDVCQTTKLNKHSIPVGDSEFFSLSYTREKFIFIIYLPSFKFTISHLLRIRCFGQCWASRCRTRVTC